MLKFTGYVRKIFIGVALFALIGSIIGVNFKTPKISAAAVCTTQNITAAGINRQYKLYTPSSTSGKPAAVVVIEASGCNVNGNTYDAATGTNFDTLADQNGFLSVYPVMLAANNGWNDNGRNTNDTQFISAIIDQLIANNNADPNRIYVAGASGGGFMVYNLVCDIANKIAGAVSISGGFHSLNYQGCSPARTVPFLEIHGTKDISVPYDSCSPAGSFCYGTRLFYTDAPSSIAYMAGFLKCSSSYTTSTTTYGLTSHLWSPCNGSTSAVTQFLIQNGGHHAWGGVLSTSNTTCCQAQVNNLVWSFLSTHSVGSTLPPTTGSTNNNTSQAPSNTKAPTPAPTKTTTDKNSSNPNSTSNATTSQSKVKDAQTSKPFYKNHMVLVGAGIAGLCLIAGLVLGFVLFMRRRWLRTKIPKGHITAPQTEVISPTKTF